MIIGNGLVAKGFKDFDNPNYVILASGVSNSLETDIFQFNKEREVILNAIKTYPNKKFVYFSTVLIDSIDSPYYNHKKEMEQLVINNTKEYAIFRVPQLVSNTGNSNNLINHLKDKIVNGRKVVIYEGVKRSLLGIEDLVAIVNIIINKVVRGVIDIAGVEILSVINICEILAEILNKPLHIAVKSKKENSEWVTKNDILVKNAFKILDIESENYSKNLIKKYFKI
tara:strand:- start:7475 stop:8152 length:678 start_codon:yes stop_codon:yes gene_type:complete